MQKTNFVIIALLLFLFSSLSGCSKNSVNENTENKDDIFWDILTPEYYNSSENDPFKVAVDQFLQQARKEVFHHPLKNESGQIPSFTVPGNGKFGAAKGPNQDVQYHPAVDLHVGNRETNVNLYAAFDGKISTVRDAEKYRHYVSITTNVQTDNDQLLGMMVALYSHVDLDRDESAGIDLNGQTVNKGDIISKHLYSETVGGPHLHFEIRYYRANDSGNETFYGGNSGPFGNPDFSEPSAGPWSYGYWHPGIGYGFVHPGNHGLHFYDD